MPGTYALELNGIRKSYGGVPALRNGNLKVATGSIHGVVGPNGAGKSTLIKIASGMVRRDDGEILVNGTARDFSSVPDALGAGVVAMPQELTIVPTLSVAENITLGLEPSRWGLVTRRRSADKAAAILDQIQVSLPLDKPAGELEPAEQRVVMLARALHTGAHTLILDEPTAALTAAHAEVFLKVVEGLRKIGVSVVYISHRFNEVVRLSDEITILRDGKTVDLLQGARRNEDELVSAVLAEGAVTEPIIRKVGIRGSEVPRVELRGIREGVLQELSLTARPGEILGLCGLPGSGVNQLMEILGGVARPEGGEILVNGSPVQFHEPADALEAGVSYLPVERARAGLFDLSIRANLVVSSFKSFSRFGLTNRSMEAIFSNPVISELGLAKRIEEPLHALSGGNRQKVLMSRCLLANSKIIVLDDPTVGVDVKARHEIHELLARIADEGRAVILAVSEPEELISIADKVHVLSRGQIVATFTGSDITGEALVRAVTSGGDGAMGRVAPSVQPAN